VHYMDRSRFGADLSIEEGMILAFAQPDGSEIPGIIRSVAGDSVTVDFNHPLAGQTVIFDVEIVDVKSGANAQGEK
jgi:FKBP-type peptidyl-prolyl cis-trans isomerase SlpA